MAERKLLHREHQRNFIDPEIVRLAAEGGHSVLFTLPYCSDLQNIELVWAKVKPGLAKLYY